MRYTPLAAPLFPFVARRGAASIPEAGAPKRGGRWVFYLVPVVAAALFLKNVLGEKESNNNNEETTKFDTEKLYATKSTKDLAFNWLILKLCSYDFVVEYGPRLYQWAEEHYLTIPARWFMKYTFFKHFVAGETQEETLEAVENLKRAGMGIVLDYSIEAGSGTKEELDKVAQDIISTVHIAARDPAHAFACLKVSGLTSFALLERLSQLITYYNSTPKSLPVQWNENNINNNFEYSPRLLPFSPAQPTPPPPLTPAEKQELNELMARLEIICKESHDSHVSILFDAEQTYYQPAIDCLTLHFCKKYNRNAPIVYNTYQMYLKDGPKRLLTDINTAKKDGYILGIKLVRGAYMHTERRRATEMGYTDPVSSNITATHANYAEGLEIAFANLPNVGVMVASHNEDTVINTISRLRDLKVDPKNPRVQFGQLYGMGDHLSFLLVQNGLRVFKYVPYGPLEEVIPYLIRRMQENRGFIGSASDTERKLLWRELRRRLGFGSTPAGPAKVPTRGAL